MLASAYMLSLLVRQYVFLVDAFQNRYPSSWLIWEPGSWRPARTTREANTAITHVGDDPHGARPIGTDALCFELKNAAGQRHTLGRSSESDIFINDLTLSREHLVLTFDSQRWQVAVAPTSSVSTSVDGVVLSTGAPVPLRSGARLEAGEVHLTYYDGPSFLSRLKDEASRLTTG